MDTPRSDAQRVILLLAALFAHVSHHNDVLQRTGLRRAAVDLDSACLSSCNEAVARLQQKGLNTRRAPHGLCVRAARRSYWRFARRWGLECRGLRDGGRCSATRRLFSGQHQHEVDLGRAVVVDVECQRRGLATANLHVTEEQLLRLEAKRRRCWRRRSPQQLNHMRVLRSACCPATAPEPVGATTATAGVVREALWRWRPL